MKKQDIRTLFAAAATAVVLTINGGGRTAGAVSHALPEFICTVRAYGGAGYDEFQRRSMKELGLDYVQGLVDFTWDNIERGDNVWKWIATDEQMDQLAKSGLKGVAFSGWGTGKRKPVTQDVAISIAPASRATRIDMLGTQKAVEPDTSGNVTIPASSSPIYLKVGE